MKNRKIKILRVVKLQDLKVLVRFSNGENKIIYLDEHFSKLSNDNISKKLFDNIRLVEKNHIEGNTWLRINADNLYQCKSESISDDEAEKLFKEKYKIKTSWITRRDLINYSITLIAIGLSIFFYLKTIKERDLSYAIFPNKTIIVKADQSSKLKIQFDNIDVKNDIYSEQIVIWNNGSLPIERDDILKPITINAPEEIKILEAKVIKEMRKESKVLVQQRDNENIDVDFRILEKNDGALIQIIYEGSTNSKFEINGSIKEQSKVSIIEYKKDTKRIDSSPIGISVVLSFPLMGLLMFFYTYMQKKRFHMWIFNLPLGFVMFIGYILIFLVILYIVNFFIATPTIPFN